VRSRISTSTSPAVPLAVLPHYHQLVVFAVACTCHLPYRASISVRPAPSRRCMNMMMLCCWLRRACMYHQAGRWRGRLLAHRRPWEKEKAIIAPSNFLPLLRTPYYQNHRKTTLPSARKGPLCLNTFFFRLRAYASTLSTTRFTIRVEAHVVEDKNNFTHSA